MEKLTIDSFRGGINKQAENTKVPLNAFRTGKLLRVDTGGLKLSGGVQNLFASRSGTVTGFARFVTQAGTPYIVFGQSDGSTQEVYAYNENTTAITQITGGSFLAGVRIHLLAAGDYLYATTGSLMYVWDGSGTFEPAGVPTNTDAPLIDDVASSGNLDNTATGTDYQWVYTYEDDRGQESNRSGISAGVDLAGKQVELHAPAYEITGDWAGKTISWVNFYRRGNTVEDFLFSGRSAFVDNTDVDYVDNIADENLTLRVPPVASNDPPPDMIGMVLHDGRMWGFDPFGARLYYSMQGQYEFFSSFTERAEIDGGFIDLDVVEGNDILCLASTGSLLVVGMVKGIHSIMWDSEKYAPRQESNQGVASVRGMTRGDNNVYYLGRDLLLYRLGDADGINMVPAIEEDLKTSGIIKPKTDYNSGAIVYHERKVIFTNPGATRYYSVHIDTGVVEELSSLYSAIDYLSSPPPGGGKNDLLVAPYSGLSGASLYTDVSGSAYRGIVKGLMPTVPTALTAQYKTDILFGFPQHRKRIHRIQILGSVTQGSPAVALNLYEDGVARTIAFTGTSGELLDTSPSLYSSAYEYELEIAGKCSAIDIREIIIYYYILEEKVL